MHRSDREPNWEPYATTIRACIRMIRTLLGLGALLPITRRTTLEDLDDLGRP